MTWTLAGDVAVVVGTIVAAIGLILAFGELRRSTAVQRAEFLLNATRGYFGSAEQRRLYYDLDYNRFQLNFAKGAPTTVKRGNSEAMPFLGSEEERLLDELLYGLDVIGRIVDMGVLAQNDASVFRFQAARVIWNRYVQEYLTWLANERKTHGGGEIPPFQAARRLAGLPGLPIGRAGQR